MARPKATQAQVDAVRSNIRRAAAELYLEQGLTNLTARAIAQRAGVSVGTLYVHFGNLSELARSLWQGPVDQFEQELETLAAKTADPVKRIRLMLGAYLDFARKHPDLYRGTFLFVRPPNQQPPDQQDFKTSAFARLMIGAVKAGQQSGTLIRQDAASQVQLLWATLHGMLALPVNLDRFTWKRVNDKTIIDSLVRMISHV